MHKLAKDANDREKASHLKLYENNKRTNEKEKKRKEKQQFPLDEKLIVLFCYFLRLFSYRNSHTEKIVLWCKTRYVYSYVT